MEEDTAEMIICWMVVRRTILRRIIMVRMIIRTVVQRIIMLRVTLLVLGGIEHAINIKKKKGFFVAKLRKSRLHRFSDKVVI